MTSGQGSMKYVKAKFDFKDLTIQIDPHVSGFLKLPDLLDMMSRCYFATNTPVRIESVSMTTYDPSCNPGL